jgi:hypothetical protein
MMTFILASQAWDDLMARLDGLFSGATEGVFAFLLALLVGLVGWAVAAIVATLVRLLLRALRFNEGVRGLAGGGTRGQEPAALAAWGIYWGLIAVALILALDTMGLRLAEAVTVRLGEVLPRIVAAGFLLAIGVLVAMLLGALTRRFFDTAGLRGGRLRGQAVTVVLTGFAVLVALEQLGLAAQFVMAIGLIVLAAVGLALGLAFGLGCRELARDFVIEYLRSMEEQGPQRPA